WIVSWRRAHLQDTAAAICLKTLYLKRYHRANDETHKISPDSAAIFHRFTDFLTEKFSGSYKIY
ncbi:MAG: hypothetical protein ACI4PV_06920, partial [Butyricicoccus sp.]